MVEHNFVHDVNYHGIYTQARIHSRFPDPGETPSALNTIMLNHIKENLGSVTSSPCATSTANVATMVIPLQTLAACASLTAYSAGMEHK